MGNPAAVDTRMTWAATYIGFQALEPISDEERTFRTAVGLIEELSMWGYRAGVRRDRETGADRIYAKRVTTMGGKERKAQGRAYQRIMADLEVDDQVRVAAIRYLWGTA